MTKAEAVKNRIWHSLSPETAAAAGLSLAELQQVIAGTVVESRCGAVALGCTYLFPPLSSGGALVV